MAVAAEATFVVEKHYDKRIVKEVEIARMDNRLALCAPLVITWGACQLLSDTRACASNHFQFIFSTPATLMQLEAILVYVCVLICCMFSYRMSFTHNLITSE